MDSSLKIDPSASSKSTSKIINNIHRMPWLKQDSSSQNGNVQQSVGKDGKILSVKKTDEDYFPGTREVKKGKKKKEKKGKSVSVAIRHLEDLMNLTQQQNEKKVTPVQDSNEISIPNTQEETELVLKINQTTSNNTVWSTSNSTADKLFPNVQSVRIDRSDEEEMLSRAIAESIATIQLEQFNKPSPVKEDRWETLYGDDDDEGSWDNIRRNLPCTPETTDSKDDTSSQGKNRDDNNNSSKTGGILRNKQQNFNPYFTQPKELDFCFKKRSDSSEDEIKTDQSTKSVSFNESIAVKVRSSESSEYEECEEILNGNKKEPNIDKYGRVDGYSERRLFMGKGARMREIEFLKNRCSLEVKEMPSQNSDTNSKAIAMSKTQRLAITHPQSSKNVQPQTPIPIPKEPEVKREFTVENSHTPLENGCLKIKSNSSAEAIIKTEEPVIITPQCPENLQSQEVIPNVEEPETKRTVAVKNFHRPLETRNQNFKANSQASAIIETQKPVKTTSQYLKNVHSQKSISNNLENPKVKEAIAAKNVHRTPVTPKNTKHNTDNAEKLTISVVRSTVDKPSTDSLPVSQNSTVDSSTVEMKSVVAEKAELKPTKSEAQTIKGTENIERPDDITSNTSDGTGMKEEQINHYENETVSPITATIISAKEKPEDEINNTSQRDEILEKKDVKDLVGNIVSQAMMAEDLAKVLKIVDNVSGEEPDSKSRCLVPTLVRQDEYMPTSSTTNFECTDLIEAMLNPKFQSSARRNLLLAGVSYLDTSCDDQSSMTHDLDSQNLQYPNYSIRDSVPVNIVPLQSQSFNDPQYIQPACIRSGNGIYQNTPINQLPNLNNNAYSMLPNYGQVANNLQTDYAHFIHRLGLQNSANQSVGFTVNPDHVDVFSLMESRQNVISSESIEDSGSMACYNNLSSQEKTDNEGRQFSAQAMPGSAKRVQLPPGFTKKESMPRDYVIDEDNRVMNLHTETKGAKDVKPKQGNFCKKRSELQSKTNNYREETSGNFARTKPGHYGRNSKPNTVQTNRPPLKKRQNYNRSQIGFERQETKYSEDRKVPYPILGATQNSRENCSYSKSDELKSSEGPKLNRDAIINQSSNGKSESVFCTIDDNMSENSMGPQHSRNNNYLTSSTLNTTLDLGRQEMNNLDTVSQSALPVICQIPNHQSLGSSSMANWQYNVNFMNQTQVPINFMPNYQMPAPHPQNFIANAPADYSREITYPNLGFQQLPMHMFNPAQIPAYVIPRQFNIENQDLQSVRPENIESFGMNSTLNHDPSIKMQQSIIRAPSCLNYNLNQAPMGQFLSNSNFYQTESIPNMQDSWNAHNNHTNTTTDQISNYVGIGRGRGRLAK